MIGGIQKIAAEYGWALRTSVVYANDEFDYSEEPQQISHRPVRPGMDRGDLYAAYAVATHRDGRRQQIVLHPVDVEKRRAQAQTQNVWKTWPEAMWSKSAGHALFKKLPLDPADQRIARIIRDDFDDPIAALYGPEGQILRTGPEAPTDDAITRQGGEGGPTGDGGPVDDAKLEAAALPEDPGAAVSPEPAPDEEEAVWEVAPTEEEIDAAGAIVVPKGVHKGSTLAQVAETDGADTWFLTQLKNIPDGEPVKASFETFVTARMPEVWERYEAHRAEQS